MIPASKSPKIRMAELRTKRKSLWEQFENNPNEIQLAAELRITDDLIADCNEKRNHRGDDIAPRGHNIGPGPLGVSVG